MREPRIILWDLETLPNLPEALKIWTSISNYPGLTFKATISTIICGGWKVLGEDKVHCINAWDFKSRWKKDVNDDEAVVKALSKVLQTADVIVTHNGKRFDYKFLQTRLIYHGLPPLPKILHIDTKVESKKHLLAFNNSLNTLSRAFTETEKLENGGWDLWIKVHGKDKPSMELMEKYCKQDVIALEHLFKRLRPLMKDLPNANLFHPEGTRCPNCGSLSLTKQGLRYAKEKVSQQYKCLDCYHWSHQTIKGKHPVSL